jgi:hypothetical protein
VTFVRLKINILRTKRVGALNTLVSFIKPIRKENRTQSRRRLVDASVLALTMKSLAFPAHREKRLLRPPLLPPALCIEKARTKALNPTGAREVRLGGQGGAVQGPGLDEHRRGGQVPTSQSREALRRLFPTSGGSPGCLEDGPLGSQRQEVRQGRTSRQTPGAPTPDALRPQVLPHREPRAALQHRQRLQGHRLPRALEADFRLPSVLSPP